MSIPLAKESPFLEPMKNTFFEMAKSGILENIWEKYTYTPSNVQCEEKKVNIEMLCTNDINDSLIHIFFLDIIGIQPTHISCHGISFWTCIKYCN